MLRSYCRVPTGIQRIRGHAVEHGRDVGAATEALGPSPEMSALLRYLFDIGVHGADAVMVTVQVMGSLSGRWSRTSDLSRFSPLRRSRKGAVRMGRGSREPAAVRTVQRFM